MPSSYTTPYSVTYSSVTDTFDFIFNVVFSTVSIPRVGMTYKPNLSLTDAMTFYSQPLYNNTVCNGVTVSWALCTSPTATSAQDLFDQVVALYTGGGGGTVTSVGAGTGISMTGTSSNPIVNIANTGVGTGSTTLSAVTRNAQGQITAISDGTGAQINTALGYTAADVANVVNSITAGTGVTLGGTATNPVINASGGGGGVPVGGVLGWARLQNTTPGAALNNYFTLYFDTLFDSGTTGTWTSFPLGQLNYISTASYQSVRLQCFAILGCVIHATNIQSITISVKVASGSSSQSDTTYNVMPSATNAGQIQTVPIYDEYIDVANLTDQYYVYCTTSSANGTWTVKSGSLYAYIIKI